MPRPRPNRPRLRSNADWLEVVADIAAGTGAAREHAVATLRREVGDHVAYIAALPIAWLDDSEPLRRTIAQLVLDRLEADDFCLLKEWRGRALRGQDHATFSTMLKTVTWYVSLRYAQRAERADAVTSSTRHHRGR